MQPVKRITAAMLLSVPFVVVAPAATAEALELSANVSLVSDYVSRGYSYSNGRPALQGGFDLEHESGLYAGIWGSSVSASAIAEGSDGVELDLYAGFAGELGMLGYDIGVAHYIFPGSQPRKDTDSTELYLGVSWEFLSLTYYRDIDFKSNYYNLDIAYPLLDNLTLDASLGYTDPDDDASYRDWRFGASTEQFGLNLGLHYISSNVKDEPNFDDVLVLSLTRYF
ncbi:TorF family putative porin [Nitrincola alkalilacustris]|uniref:TorF family putative porin n=1 Tax=Nitrincola alkalilacustris TaxID=1571224 RepID=UPI0014576A6F|nr:TorF family putative porin [Nitrincola alkalilacustris]